MAGTRRPVEALLCRAFRSGKFEGTELITHSIDVLLLGRRLHLPTDEVRRASRRYVHILLNLDVHRGKAQEIVVAVDLHFARQVGQVVVRHVRLRS